MRVFVLTNDYYLWALTPFTYLFNRYWNAEQEVVVAGYRAPSVQMPDNFRFHSLGRANVPQEQWSNSLMQFLDEMKDDFSIIMLEDYWISRPVDTRLINLAHVYMEQHNNVLRMDLTGDVAHCHGDSRYAFDVGFLNSYDIVEKPPGKSYRMSFQAAMWNNKLLRSLLKPNKNPWDVEIYTKVPDDWRVLGTKQWPLRYINAVWKGEIDMAEINKLNEVDLEMIKKFIPDNMSRRKYDKQ